MAAKKLDLKQGTLDVMVLQQRGIGGSRGDRKGS